MLLRLSYQKGVKYSDILDVVGTGNSKYDSAVVQAVSGAMTRESSSRKTKSDGEAVDWELAKALSDVSSKNTSLSKLLISAQRGSFRKTTIPDREKVEVLRNYPDRVYRDLFVRLRMSTSHKVYSTIVFREMFGINDDSIHRCICEHNIDGAWHLLEKWLWENGPFIVYVEESDSFVVDVAAKTARRPVPFCF
ncbi:hypothetical protein [Planctopirus hydrillae]|uniref:hypothetical protein n=1 Tax=Planctopirus hydrillae TaxID=1841610 RepID=UPI001041F600|nr:hypothetical protein [Planctopirus hydrillae]